MNTNQEREPSRNPENTFMGGKTLDEIRAEGRRYDEAVMEARRKDKECRRLIEENEATLQPPHTMHELLVDLKKNTAEIVPGDAYAMERVKGVLFGILNLVELMVENAQKLKGGDEDGSRSLPD